MRELTLADGRRLAYEVLGAPDGYPVIVLHGTPGSARQVAMLDVPARERGVALIAPDRAGYGGSSNDPRRTIASGAADVEALRRHLSLETAAVVGLSGGGPTALACGAVMADKVASVTTVGSVAPLLPRDPSLPPDRLITRVARRSEVAARVLLAAMVSGGRTNPEQALDRSADRVAEPDARLMRDDEAVRSAFLDDLRHLSPTTARAAARDFALFARPWNVELTAIKAPTHVWHGTEDRNVPVAHAHVIAARCPAARLQIVEGGGHMLLEQLDAIFAAIIGSSQR
jgi:pimeloyl-ACP methyl ester carboxylesterase